MKATLLKRLLIALLLFGPASVSLAQNEPPPATPPATPPPATPPTTPPAPRPSVQTPLGGYPLPISDPYHWRYALALPSPALFQSRGDNRPRRLELQFPVAVYGGLGYKKGWGHFFLASENVISTDAFDNSARIGLRFGVEHSIYRTGPLLTTEIGVVTNQRAQNQALGGSVGTRFLLPFRVSTGEPDLQLNFLGFENRRRLNIDASPQHTGHDVLVSSATLGLPPICFGQRDPNTRPNLLLRTHAWYFYNEEAAPGYRPRDFETKNEFALIVPIRSVRKKTPFLKSVAISYIFGANDGNDYAQQRNFRINFILEDTRRLLDELTEHGVIPKVPDIKLPGTKPTDKSTEPTKTDTPNPVNSSTNPENTGNAP